MADALTKLIESTNAQCEAVNKRAETLKNNTAVAAAAAKGVFQKLHQLLDQETHEIDKMKTEEEDEAGIQTKYVTLDVQPFDSLRLFVNDLLNKGTVFDRLKSLPDVRERLQASRRSAASEMMTDLPSSAELLVKSLNGCHVTLEKDIVFQQSDPVQTVQIVAGAHVKCVMKGSATQAGPGR